MTVCSQGWSQSVPGSWVLFSSFNTVDQLIDTPRQVYYTTCGNLYAYLKDADETYDYTHSNKLTDSNISRLYYNYDKQYLVIVYANSNIDIVDRDDVVYNMPDIKDASLDVIPIINDIAFDENRIYVATNFGIVVFDSERKEVVTAGNYGMNITSTVVVGETLWLIESYKYHCVDKHRNLTSASVLNHHVYGYTTSYIKPLADDLVVVLENGSKIAVIKLVPEADQSRVITTQSTTNVGNLHPMSDGSIMCHTTDRLYIISPRGDITSTSLSGTDLQATANGGIYQTKQLGAWKGLDSIWMGSDDGISNYSLTADATVTVLSQPARPDNTLTFANIGRLTTSSTGAVYAASHGYSLLIGEAINPGNKGDDIFYINKIVDDEITDITPLEYTTQNTRAAAYTKAPVGFKGGYQMIEDPNDSESYIVGRWWDGFIHYTDRRENVHYYEGNSTLLPVNNGYRLQANGMDLDAKGNLWVSQLVSYGPEKLFHMLPAKKIGQSTTAADWYSVGESYLDPNHDGNLLACKHSNNIYYISGKFKGEVIIVKTRGTDTTDDDEIISTTNLIDQDGLLFSYTRMYSIAEDHDGHVWIGTDNGIIEITNPDKADESVIPINHLKVPRRDGTNFADYLLAGEKVYDIAVDSSNRKWAATAASGIYLISPRGDEILEHFDNTNSPLTTNTVWTVACAPDNSVYIGTANGLLKYNSHLAPSRDDYSAVYAYPNPVRPDYTGWITVTGLIDNSLVKIADAAGNVFFQGTSNGGMIVWDGCDTSGRRVNTGVYYVFASTGGDGNPSKGAVTKIMVIN